MKKIFSFDAETNGLWGKAFAIGVVVREEDGTIKEFLVRCPIDEPVSEWVQSNVLTTMTSIEETHESYESMLADFIKFYMDNKQDADVIVHMGLPVEARLFIDAHNMGILGDWDAPYPLIDISAFREINDSVDTYNKNNNIVVNCDGGTHNPLYDSYAALYAYEHIMNK